MKKRFFITNLFMFLIPVLIPVLILGALSIAISQRFITQDIRNSNLSLLNQAKESTELMLKELDALSLTFDKDPVVVNRLKKILSSDNLTLAEFEALDYIKSYVDVPANTKPFIHSIYVAFDVSSEKFISSSQIISYFETYTDQTWYDQYLAHKNQDFWGEKRSIRRYEFENESTPVLTLYKKLFFPGTHTSSGVVVLNILSSYVENFLASLATIPNQTLIVTDENYNLLFQSSNAFYVESVDFHQFQNKETPFYETNLLDELYAVAVLKSDLNEWHYFCITPERVLYKLTRTFFFITILLLLASLILATLAAYYLTKKNYSQVDKILSIMYAAERGDALPPMPSRVTDLYGYIIQNILKTFIEQTYLKVQLSERQSKMKLMEMIALQSQINPHFLNNTLHTIYWETLALTGKPNLASQMISYLNDILAYSLSAPNECITLEEEIAHTRNYIAILKIRYKEKFDVVWEYEPEVLTEKVIKLLLQPLIENAIYHGIKECPRKGIIKIKLRISNGLLKIAIIDNGLGIEPQTLALIKNELIAEGDYTEHIGLFNTNKRLKLQYSNIYGIQIRSRYGSGTAIYLTLPTSTI